MQTWTNEITMNMEQVLELCDPVVPLDVNDLLKIMIPLELKNPDTFRRVAIADLSYPIIVAMSHGEIHRIIDGNHRVKRAFELGNKTINAYVLDLDKQTVEVKFLFK